MLGTLESCELGPTVAGDAVLTNFLNTSSTLCREREKERERGGRNKQKREWEKKRDRDWERERERERERKYDDKIWRDDGWMMAEWSKGNFHHNQMGSNHLGNIV